MGTDTDGYAIPGKSSKGWVVTLLALAGAGGAGWFAYKEHEHTAASDGELVSLRQKLVDADAKQRELAAKIETIESDRAVLAAAKDELSKDVQSKDEELAKLKATSDELKDKLAGELKAGDIHLTEAGGKLRVDLVDKILFNSGEAAVSKRGEGVLLKLGAILAAIPDRLIQVSGHTDQTPMSEKKSALFPTNWELSVARATNVVRFLQEQAHVPGERLVASGYGEYHAVASNKTPVGRARNRRIEILLTPTLAPKAIATSKLKAEAKPGALAVGDAPKREVTKANAPAKSAPAVKHHKK